MYYLSTIDIKLAEQKSDTLFVHERNLLWFVWTILKSVQIYL